MSWRSGGKLFAEMWPLIHANIPEKEHRIEFTAFLLQRMVNDDMDPFDIEDIHPEVRESMRKAEIALAEPDRYKDEELSEEPKRRWWRR